MHGGKCVDVKDAPYDPLNVERSVDALESAVAGLHDIVIELERRLTPLLAAFPLESEKDLGAEGFGCILGGRVASCTDRIAGRTRQLSELISRL